MVYTYYRLHFHGWELQAHLLNLFYFGGEMATTENAKASGKTLVQLEDPAAAKFLWGDVRISWFWLILRVYIGYQWLEAGYVKLISPAWFGSQAGTALAGFLKGALAKTAGAHPDVEGWYATFLTNMVLPHVNLWSHVVTIGELLVGLGLILGMFTGIAAFFGSFMNVNYLFAGTVSINPLLFVIGTWLVLAWKTAGWLGLDHWVLPALGTPWAPGKIFSERKSPKTGS
jgi:thiosulfate dehydrogenase [quinone] large subunit